MSTQVIKEQISLSPEVCGIYKMIWAKNKVLYLGKVKNLIWLSDYLQFEKASRLIKTMLSQVIRVETFATKNEVEALLLESQLIKALKSSYNVRLKMGSPYPYKIISIHNHQRIAKYRGKLKKKNLTITVLFLLLLL